MLGIGYTNYLPAAIASATVVSAGIKRSSDDFLSPTTLVANGGGMSPVQTELLSNDAKKAKLEPSVGRPSRVVHFRNVPSDAIESEIISIGLPFGKMTNLVLAKKKNQALLEMADLQSAQQLVNYYSERPPQIRGRMIYIQFSNHDQLKTDLGSQTPVSQSAPQPQIVYTTAAAIQQQQQHQQQQQQLQQQQLQQQQLQQQQLLIAAEEEPKTVLRVIIEQMVCSVSIELLKQIFSRYGHVLKIITFNKNNTFQALIQFADANNAQAAKLALNGQNIFNGGCTLRIDYSHLQNLNVKYNNDKSRDFTNPSLPASEDGLPQQPQQPQTVTIDGVMYSIGGLPPTAGKMQSTSVAVDPAEFGFITGHAGMQQTVIASPLSAPTMPTFAPQMAFSAASPFGGVPIYASELPGAAPTAMAPPQFVTAQTAVGLPHGLPGLQTLTLPGTLGQLISMQDDLNYRSSLPAATMPAQLTREGMTIAYPTMVGPGGLTFVTAAQASAILLVSNLNEEKVTPDALFTLFGVYGDVIRVKIMFNKKDNALVQYVDPNQARVAMMYLDKVTLWGKKLKVTLSKHTTVQMPKEGQPDAGLTKEYLNSPLHRYKKPLSKNYNNIFPPSATLHLSNIPPTTSETDLKRLFTEFGDIVAFKFFQKDHKMALIQMGTVEQAIEALVALHNYELTSSNHLRISFTKSVI